MSSVRLPGSLSPTPDPRGSLYALNHPESGNGVSLSTSPLSGRTELLAPSFFEENDSRPQSPSISTSEVLEASSLESASKEYFVITRKDGQQFQVQALDTKGTRLCLSLSDWGLFESLLVDLSSEDVSKTGTSFEFSPLDNSEEGVVLKQDLSYPAAVSAPIDGGKELYSRFREIVKSNVVSDEAPSKEPVPPVMSVKITPLPETEVVTPLAKEKELTRFERFKLRCKTHESIISFVGRQVWAYGSSRDVPILREYALKGLFILGAVAFTVVSLGFGLYPVFRKPVSELVKQAKTSEDLANLWKYAKNDKERREICDNAVTTEKRKVLLESLGPKDSHNLPIVQGRRAILTSATTFEGLLDFWCMATEADRVLETLAQRATSPEERLKLWESVKDDVNKRKNILNVIQTSEEIEYYWSVVDIKQVGLRTAILERIRTDSDYFKFWDIVSKETEENRTALESRSLIKVLSKLEFSVTEKLLTNFDVSTDLRWQLFNNVKRDSLFSLFGFAENNEERLAIIKSDENDLETRMLLLNSGLSVDERITILAGEKSVEDSIKLYEYIHTREEYLKLANGISKDEERRSFFEQIQATFPLHQEFEYKKEEDRLSAFQGVETSVERLLILSMAGNADERRKLLNDASYTKEKLFEDLAGVGSFDVHVDLLYICMIRQYEFILSKDIIDGLISEYNFDSADSNPNILNKLFGEILKDAGRTEFTVSESINGKIEERRYIDANKENENVPRDARDLSDFFNGFIGLGDNELPTYVIKKSWQRALRRSYLAYRGDLSDVQQDKLQFAQFLYQRTSLESMAQLRNQSPGTLQLATFGGRDPKIPGDVRINGVYNGIGDYEITVSAIQEMKNMADVENPFFLQFDFVATVKCVAGKMTAHYRLKPLDPSQEIYK